MSEPLVLMFFPVLWHLKAVRKIGSSYSLGGVLYEEMAIPVAETARALFADALAPRRDCSRGTRVELAKLTCAELMLHMWSWRDMIILLFSFRT